MKRIYRNEIELVDIFKKIKAKGFKEPRTITDENLYRNKAPQLRAYWLLINICRSFMNNKGNNFTEEQVDEYFRQKAGHINIIDNIKVCRSIAFKSDCTKEDMQNLIETILEFGLDNEIKDCFICSYDLKDLLKKL